MLSCKENELSTPVNDSPRSRASVLKFSHRPEIWAAVVLATILLSPIFVGREASAQDSQPGGTGAYHSDTLEMAVRAGFGRLEVNTFAGSWVPMRVTIANQGDPISGRLIIRAESSQGPNPTYREFVKDVQLPTGSRQFHEISAFLSSGGDVEISLVSNNVVVAHTAMSVMRTAFGGEQLEVAVVDTEATTLNGIASTEIVRPANREPFSRRSRTDTAIDPDNSASQPRYPGPPGRRGRRGMPWYQPQSPAAHPSVTSREDLPRDFVSYDPIDALVIGDAPLGQLTEEQVQALKLWVASGGLLVVTGAADMAGLRASGLDGIMPVDSHGSVTVPSLLELTTTYNLFESAEPLLVVSASTRPGARALLGTQDRTLAAEKYYGSGLVRFVAINPKINPYRGWGAAKDLWNDLLLPAAESKLRSRNWITMGQWSSSGTSRWGIQNVLFNLAEIRPTSTHYFLIFLALYVLAVGPINYLVLRWMRKTDLAWATIPAIVILFTAVSVTIAQVNSGADSVASDVSLVELHQRHGISRVTGGMLIRPTSKGTHDLTFDGAGTYVSDLAGGSLGSSSAVDNIESRHAGSRFTMRVPMDTGTAGIFQVRSVSENNGPLLVLNETGDAKVAPTAKIPAGKSNVILKNLGASRITNAIYVSAEGISDLFNLEAGEEKSVGVMPPGPGPLSAWYKTQLDPNSPEGAVFDGLEVVLDKEVGGERAFAQEFFRKPLMQDAIRMLEHPMVIGFVDSGPTKVTFDGSLRRRSRALYIVHL